MMRLTCSRHAFVKTSDASQPDSDERGGEETAKPLHYFPMGRTYPSLLLVPIPEPVWRSSSQLVSSGRCPIGPATRVGGRDTLPEADRRPTLAHHVSL